MNRKSWGLLAALSGMALSVPGMALAAETPTAPAAADTTQTSTPAQDATAHAVAAKVGDIASAGETDAKAGPTDAEATGNALTLGGKPPADQFGGTATTKSGDKKKSGHLLDTGETPLGRLQLTPWDAEVAQAQCRTADGKAAVARAVLVNADVLALNLLQSESHAKHCGMESSGSGSSDGATVNLGGKSGLMLTLLHSEAATGSKGETYLLNINGNKIGTDEQVGAGKCALNVPGLLGVTCLTVGGGQGSVFADVADLTLGDGQLTAKLVGTDGQAAAAPKVQGETFTPPAAEPAPARQGGSLARTGAELGGLALAGAGLMAAGGSLVAAQRKRRLFGRA